MFIKNGDGKIISVLEEEELTDDQKKSVKDLSSQVTKELADKESDAKNIDSVKKVENH